MKRSLFAQLNALAEEISSGAVKAAAEKSASPVPSDPGGYAGASTHPSANVDNSGQAASTGARASEYEADIKKQQGATSVDSAPEMSQEGRQDEVQLNIGTNVKATGEDPAAEKDYKGDKDDPGTSHPAKASDGEKYSAVSFKEAREACSSLGNDILANLINFGTEKLTKQSEMPAQLAEALHEKKESPAEEKSEDKGELKGDQHKLDTDNDGKIEGSDLASLRAGKEAGFKAGYELAAQLGLEKAAAEAAVRDVCANTLREADEMADLFIGFMSAKQAASDPTDEMAEGEDHSAPGDAASGASDAPAPAGLEAMMGGGEPAAPEAAGEPSEEEALQELAMALEELGIPPEALLQQLGGGAAPEAGVADAPKMAADKTAAELNEIGAAVVNFKRAGLFQVKEARTKKSRQLRDNMKQYVLELVNR
jgi:hypothetical protein